MLGVAASPDGDFVASSSVDHTVRLWRMGGDTVRTFTEHTSYVPSVAISADGQYVVSGSDDRTIRVWKAP